MSDEAVIKLLEEIRDLQRQHLERYGEALKNQADSIALQKKAIADFRGRIQIVLVLIVLLASTAVTLFLVTRW
jgi:hypothetical protein